MVCCVHIDLFLGLLFELNYTEIILSDTEIIYQCDFDAQNGPYWQALVSLKKVSLNLPVKVS